MKAIDQNNNDMIQFICDFDKPISQNLYDELIGNLSLFQVTCPCCEKTGNLIWYGTYIRHVKEDGEYIQLVVKRTLCQECSKDGHLHTHAMMLVSVVPYSQVPLRDQAAIAEAYESHGDYEDILHKNPLLDMNYVFRMLSAYIMVWRERIRSESINLSPVKTLADGCFKYYASQFMQIKRLPNIYFSPPT